MSQRKKKKTTDEVVLVEMSINDYCDLVTDLLPELIQSIRVELAAVVATQIVQIHSKLLRHHQHSIRPVNKLGHRAMLRQEVQWGGGRRGGWSNGYIPQRLYGMSDDLA